MGIQGRSQGDSKIQKTETECGNALAGQGVFIWWNREAETGLSGYIRKFLPR